VKIREYVAQTNEKMFILSSDDGKRQLNVYDSDIHKGLFSNGTWLDWAEVNRRITQEGYTYIDEHTWPTGHKLVIKHIDLEAEG